MDKTKGTHIGREQAVTAVTDERLNPAGFGSSVIRAVDFEKVDDRGHFQPRLHDYHGAMLLICKKPAPRAMAGVNFYCDLVTSPKLRSQTRMRAYGHHCGFLAHPPATPCLHMAHDRFHSHLARPTQSVGQFSNRPRIQAHPHAIVGGFPLPTRACATIPSDSNP